MNLPKFYLIADLEAAGNDPSVLLRKLEDCLAAGVKLVQLRAPKEPSGAFWNLAERASRLAAGYGAMLLVNDRADIAFGVGAAGVHLPSTGLPVDGARRLFSQEPIGVSCHSLKDCLAAQEDGANYVLLSPIWESSSKPGRKGQGVEWLAEICRQVSIPVYALSGVTPERAQSCLDAGAQGVAVMTALMTSEDADAVARAYLEALG